jgi:uncharacterized protein (DUF1015 family)
MKNNRQLGEITMYDEQKENDNFVKLVGGIHAADRLQQLWNQSYSTGGYLYPISKEKVFEESARREKFSKKAIKAFMKLR